MIKRTIRDYGTLYVIECDECIKFCLMNFVQPKYSECEKYKFSQIE